MFTVFPVADMVCLATYVANGHIQAFSLPSLKPLLDVDFLPSTEVRYQTNMQSNFLYWLKFLLSH